MTTRRRFLSITALAGVLGASCRRRHEAVETHAGAPPHWSWNGVLFGADTSIQLHGISDESKAHDLTQRCFNEMRRLEQMFSLYQPDSILCKLNRAGRFADCPEEFLDLMAVAGKLNRSTDGAFDVTVQPLWQCLANRKSASAFEEALALVGFANVAIDDRGGISFATPGMAVTLNGIAQGFITDRITSLLRSNGVDRALVNMGEYAAIGQHPDGRMWELGIRAPGDGEGDSWIESMPLGDQALSVSGGYGNCFNFDGSRHHLLHPRTGRNLSSDRTIAVVAPDATLADALSTACAVVDDATAREFSLRHQCKLRIYRGQERVS